MFRDALKPSYDKTEEVLAAIFERLRVFPEGNPQRGSGKIPYGRPIPQVSLSPPGPLREGRRWKSSIMSWKPALYPHAKLAEMTASRSCRHPGLDDLNPASRAKAALFFLPPTGPFSSSSISTCSPSSPACSRPRYRLPYRHEDRRAGPRAVKADSL